MKKVLCLSLITCSIFSSQLDLVKFENKVDRFQEKLLKRDFINTDYTNKVRIESTSVFVPHQLGSLELYHGKNGFSVLQDNKKHKIQKCFTDKMVRNIKREQLYAFLQNGYLSIKQMNDGEFKLEAKGRINGGGPILGAIAYWVTKSVCYGTAVAAVGTIAVGTGGAAVALATSGAVVAGTGAVTGAAVATTVASVTTAAAATGATVAATTAATVVAGSAITGGLGTVAGAIAVTGLAGEAAVVTAGVVTSAGGIAATIAGVESVSLAVGAFFGMLPLP